MGNDQFYHRARAERERRKQNVREPRKEILLICEGGKTEPYYFEGFRLTNVTIDGYGKDPSQLVEIAKQNLKNYDEIWCVFDRDSVPAEKFNVPFQLSDRQKKKIKLAYTNEAFELWYLLHFNYHDTAISRDRYKAMLSEQLGYEYRKNSGIMYAELKSRQQFAIDSAKRLLAGYNNPNPEKDNPSTTVHLLVEELNRNKK